MPVNDFVCAKNEEPECNITHGLDSSNEEWAKMLSC